MTTLSRRSVISSSLAAAAAGTLGRPYIANAAATTAEVWWNQGFVPEEDAAFRALVAEYEKARRFNDDCDLLALLGRAYAELGRTADAMHILQELNECGQRYYARNMDYALVYIGLGQKDTAISYLEKCPDNWLRINPLLDPLRDQPRFQKLVARFLPQASP